MSALRNSKIAGKFRSKDDVRKFVWEKIKPYSTFPPPHGRIPNFKAAFKACERLRELKEWKKAEFVFSAPDSPLRRARELCIEDGKTLVMVKPHMEGFLILKPEVLEIRGTLKDMLKAGREVNPRAIPEVDIFLQGCVAVDTKGNRIGKGRGYGDKEYFLLKNLGKLKGPYVVVCHELQVFDDLSHLCERYDARCDIILTPKRVIRCESVRR